MCRIGCEQGVEKNSCAMHNCLWNPAGKPSVAGDSRVQHQMQTDGAMSFSLAGGNSMKAYKNAMCKQWLQSELHLLLMDDEQATA